MEQRDAGTKALRRGRHSRIGQVYLVTFVTWRRTPLFIDEASAIACIRSLVDPRNWQKSRLLAWVLMPDHWHGLVEIGEGDGLSSLVRRIKACSAGEVARQVTGTGRIWQAGFHDHAMREEEDLVHLARYVVLNPVRAGLVRRVSEYPYWDAIWRASG
jgi:putative transposase